MLGDKETLAPLVLYIFLGSTIHRNKLVRLSTSKYFIVEDRRAFAPLVLNIPLGSTKHWSKLKRLNSSKYFYPKLIFLGYTRPRRRALTPLVLKFSHVPPYLGISWCV